VSRPDSNALFHDAVNDLAEAPTPVNVRRYLVASRLLERDRANSAAALPGRPPVDLRRPQARTA
jgi:hypothetical protein